MLYPLSYGVAPAGSLPRTAHNPAVAGLARYLAGCAQRDQIAVALRRCGLGVVPAKPRWSTPVQVMPTRDSRCSESSNPIRSTRSPLPAIRIGIDGAVSLRYVVVCRR